MASDRPCPTGGHTSRKGDRNFDDLAHRFARNIKSSLKGEIRQAVVERDFAEFGLDQPSTDKELLALDAGGGQGQMAIYLAKRGYKVVLVDVSVEMLKQASAAIEMEGLSTQIEIVHGPIQQFLRSHKQEFDLVLAHALLEWVEQGQNLFNDLAQNLKPDGFLSVLYYNFHGLVYKNLLRTNYKKVLRQDWQAKKRSLTPSYPLKPETVATWLDEHALSLQCESGVRVFYDYLLTPEARQREPETVLALELEYSRQLPYKHIGRYIHLLMQKM